MNVDIKAMAGKYGKWVLMGVSFGVGLLLDAISKKEQEEYIDNAVNEKFKALMEHRDEEETEEETEEELEDCDVEDSDEESEDEEEDEET